MRALQKPDVYEDYCTEEKDAYLECRKKFRRISNDDRRDEL